MASTQYQSIIRLLQHSGVDTEAPLNISRLKKQLSAEFDVSSTGYIDVDGFSYGKAAVLEELNRRDFEERMHYHRRLWNSKTILDLLERNALNYFELEKEMAGFNHDPDFDNLFSPYYAFTFAYLSRGYCQQGAFYEMTSLLVFEDFIQGDDREEAFRSLRIFLDESLRAFRNINTENYFSFAEEMRPWGHSGWGNMLNALPAELEDRKQNIAHYLVNVTVAIQHKKRSDCKFISRELQNVKGLSYELENLIRSNHKAYKGNAKTGKGNYWWIGWAVLVLVRILAGC